MPMPPNSPSSCAPHELAEGVRGPPTRHQQQDREKPCYREEDCIWCWALCRLDPSCSCGGPSLFSHDMPCLNYEYECSTIFHTEAGGPIPCV